MKTLQGMSGFDRGDFFVISFLLYTFAPLEIEKVALIAQW